MRLARVLAAGVLAAGLAACGGGSDDSGDKQTVTFLTHWSPDQVKMLEDAAASYEKTHETVDIQIRAVPFANLLSTLRTQGASPNGPTIASIYDLWLPELVRDGLAAPAPDKYAADIQSNWPANLVEDVTKNGKRYGYPNEVDLYALNYNKKLFADAGIADAPKTWAELETAAAKLTKPGQQGFGVITSWPAGAVHPFLSLAASNGGQMLNGTTPQLTDPKVTAVADLYQRLIASKATVADMSQANANTTGPYLDNFVNGKTGMIIMANWWQSSLKQAMGDKYKDVGVAPIPVGPNGSKSSAISYSWLTMVNGKASAAKQDAAWEFLSWLNGPESGKNGSSAMADVLMSMGILPSRNSDIKAHSTELSDPFLKVYVEQLPNATPFPTVLGGEQASQILQKNIEDIVFGKKAPADAMASAQGEAADALKKANG
jgi:multiple sugar transport system substrate-binding protein